MNDVKKFAREIISEIMSSWGCDPQYYVNSNDELESELAKNDVALIQFIEFRLKEFDDNEPAKSDAK